MSKAKKPKPFIGQGTAATLTAQLKTKVRVIKGFVGQGTPAIVRTEKWQ